MRAGLSQDVKQLCDVHPDCSPAGSEGAPQQPCRSGPSRGDGGGGGGGGSARGCQRGPRRSQSAVRPSEHHHKPPGFSQRAGRTPAAAPLPTFTLPSCVRGTSRVIPPSVKEIRSSPDWSDRACCLTLVFSAEDFWLLSPLQRRGIKTCLTDLSC